MNQLSLGLVLVAALGGSLWLAPFPHFPTWFLLVRTLLTDPNPALSLPARLRMAEFLLRQALLAPVWTALWYLDELLFPEYRRQLVQPVFLIGPPRSGTTLLHRTLAADEQTFMGIRHIEWRYPFICVQKMIAWLGLAERLKRISYWPDTPAGRQAARMHSNTLYDWEEDGSFFEERFLLHYFVFLRFPFPAILRRLDDFSELGSKSRAHILAMHQCVLQKMAYMRGHGRLYLSKEPESMTRMEAIAALYPDARFIILTRRSCEFLGSLFALIRQSTLCKTGVDPIEIPGWREANLEKKKRDCELMVDLAHKILPRARQLRLSYAGATRDIAATLLYVYEALGLTIPEEQRRRLPSLKVAQEHRKRGYDYEFEDADGFTRYDDFALNVERRHLAALTRPRYREQARAKARLRSGQDGPDSAVLDPQAG